MASAAAPVNQDPNATPIGSLGQPPPTRMTSREDAKGLKPPNYQDLLADAGIAAGSAPPGFTTAAVGAGVVPSPGAGPSSGGGGGGPAPPQQQQQPLGAYDPFPQQQPQGYAQQAYTHQQGPAQAGYDTGGAYPSSVQPMYGQPMSPYAAGPLQQQQGDAWSLLPSPPNPSSSSLADLVRRNKQALVVACVVGLLLVYALPQMRAYPRFLRPDGALGPWGVLVAASAAGIAYQGIASFV